MAGLTADRLPVSTVNTNLIYLYQFSHTNSKIADLLLEFNKW